MMRLVSLKYGPLLLAAFTVLSLTFGEVHSASAQADPLRDDKAVRSAFSLTEFDRAFTHHTVQVGAGTSQVRIHYVVGGTGAAIVLLHGYPATWYDYRMVIPILAKKYTVIAVDLRGMGDSERTKAGYDPHTMAEDVHQVVQSLGIHDAYVVGHDIGAPVAYMYAVQHPAEVRKLVELEFVAGTALEDLEQKAYPDLWFFAFQAVPDLPEKLTEGRERSYLSLFFGPYTYGGSSIAPDALDEYVRCYSAPGGMRAGFEYYRNVPLFTKFMEQTPPPKLRMPVLALAGQASMGNPALGQPAEAFIHTVAGDSRYGVIPLCGHWIAEERPAYLADQLLTFFAQTP